MKKAVVLRAKADTDIERALETYAHEAPHMLGALFEALKSTLANIALSPSIGSSRYAELLRIDGLKHGVLRRFPYMVFYIELTTEIAIVRVLHQRRDIPALLL